MLKAAQVAQLCARHFAVDEDWGTSAAFAFVWGSRFQQGDQKVVLKSDGLPFHYRGHLDRRVLGQFSNEFGFLDTTGSRPVRSVIDAGANIGVFVVQARRIYPSAHIVALEMEPDNARILQLNAAPRDVTAIRAALWREVGDVQFARSDHPESHHVSTGEGGESVPATTVKALMDQHGFGEIDLLKMDIEGAEKAVLEGADDETIDRINAIRFECNDADEPGNSAAIFDRIRRHDFDAFSVGENLYLIHRKTGWKLGRHRPGTGSRIQPMG